MKQLLEVARGEVRAEIVLRNGKIINVLSGEIHEGDIAISGNRIAGIGAYDGDQVIDLKGSYIAPSFIDGHIHLESTMLSVKEFVRAVVPRGTGGCVCDPHEFANVAGTAGIDYILSAQGSLPLDLYVMMSSCVPATPLETAGASISVEQIGEYLHKPGITGIAEMMNFPGVFLGWESEINKIAQAQGRPIDGHSPALTGKNLDAYIAAGITSDHECTSADEARDKLRRGMHILIREGTAERNMHDLLPLVTPANARHFSFATDDKHPASLMDEGHIDNHVREALAFGLDPVIVFQMASLNTARHYRAMHRGAIAPGYYADLVVFDNLADVRIRSVYKNGYLVAQDGEYLGSTDVPPVPGKLLNTINTAPFTADDFKIAANGAAKMKVIEIIPRQIVTKAVIEDCTSANGQVTADTERDILKLSVIERHNATGNIGTGFVRGFGMKEGALASTVAHDAHNIVVVGTNDEDMAAAVHELIRIGGGLCVVRNNEVLESLPLPIAGLVSDKPLEEVRAKEDALKAAAKTCGCTLSDPFMTLSFLALSPIPALKVTDQGLVDAEKFELTNLFVE